MMAKFFQLLELWTCDICSQFFLCILAFLAIAVAQRCLAEEIVVQSKQQEEEPDWELPVALGFTPVVITSIDELKPNHGRLVTLRGKLSKGLAARIFGVVDVRPTPRHRGKEVYATGILVMVERIEADAGGGHEDSGFENLDPQDTTTLQEQFFLYRSLEGHLARTRLVSDPTDYDAPHLDNLVGEEMEQLMLKDVGNTPQKKTEQKKEQEKGTQLNKRD
jgi:hypothetical protein